MQNVGQTCVRILVAQGRAWEGEHVLVPTVPSWPHQEPARDIRGKDVHIHTHTHTGLAGDLYAEGGLVVCVCCFGVTRSLGESSILSDATVTQSVYIYDFGGGSVS